LILSGLLAKIAPVINNARAIINIANFVECICFPSNWSRILGQMPGTKLILPAFDSIYSNTRTETAAKR
jgi:hypothetical protein